MRKRASALVWARRAGRAAVVTATIAVGTPALLSSAAHGDTVTAAADNLRTGWYNNQPGLTPAVVGGSSFGQLFSTAITGQVYAQPLIASNTLLVGTETNDMYGIDPATGAIRWHQNYGAPWNPLDVGCGDLTPWIGITGTPAIDQATGTAYFFSKTYVTGTSGPGEYVAHAVDVLSGNERPGWPVVISGTPTNAPGAAFNATYELQRPGLLLMNGVIYAAFGGHCDHSPYRGLVVGLSTAGVMTTMWASESSTQNGAGIWMSGTPLMSDAPGQIVLATGNGQAPVAGAGLGATPSIAFGESVVRLTVQTDGSLKATDFFTPTDAELLNTNDEDFGSGGPAGLPDSFGTAAHPHLLVVAGKQGYVYLLDRDNLGGRGAATDNVLGKFGPFGGVWSKPAVWPGDGGYVYLPSASAGTGAGGSSGFMRVYQRTLDGAGNPALSLAATSTDAFGFGSSPPMITSNGTTSGSALMWVVHTDGGTGTNATLRAYDAVPVGGVLNQRFSAPIGTASKFTEPVVDSGRVYVGTRDGHVLAFGAIGPGPALTGPSLAFSATTTGNTAQGSVTLTATRAATVTAMSIDNPAFGVGAPTPAMPATLASGATITIPVMFAPTQLGLATGTLSVTTDSGVSTIPVSGTGQAPTVPIGTSPSTINFGTVPGASLPVTSSVTFTNTGTTTQTIQGLKLPATPFTVTGAPAVGATIAPGAGLAITVTFTPPAQSGTSPTPYNDTLGITTDQASAAVPLAGTTALPANLVLPVTVPFGNVAMGTTAALSFTVANTGGSPMTILKSKPPVTGGFAATTTLAEGTVIPAGTSVTETVSFTPPALGSSSSVWTITADDGSGVQNVTFTANGVVATAVPSPGTGWQFNGSTAMNGATLQLTTASPGQAGSAFYPTSVNSSNIDVSFTSTIGGGSGADGETLAFIDPADGATGLGLNGGGLGFAGLHGVAIALDTYPNASVTSPNFVGVAQTSTTGPPGSLTFLASNTSVPALRAAPHGVHVSVIGGLLQVSIDGTPVLQTTVTLPPNVLIGFTAGTGGLTDVHSVSNVNISTVAAVVPPTVSAPPTGWKLNGKAKMLTGNTVLQLTPASTYTSGSAWYTTAVPADGLDATFTSTMSGGTGGTGTAFVLADPTTSTSALGANGSALGFAGISATAVVLNTYQSSGAPAANFVGIATSALKSASPKYVTTSTNVAGLRAGTHVVHVTVNSNVVTVSIDGTRAVQASVTLPPTVLLGFTASTGKLTDLHQVSGVGIVLGPSGTTPPPGPSLTPAPATGWQLNGLASMVGSTSLQLTPATGYGAGSAFYTHSLSSATKLTVSFTAAIDSGTGADGMCLVLADASLAAPTALGQPGGGLGYSGIPGTCVGLQTFQGATDPSSNFVGIGSSGTTDSVSWSATNTNVAGLRGAPHNVIVTFSAGLLTMTLDGAQVLTTAVALPPTLLVGFSAGNGGFTDRHAVSNVNVTVG